MGVAEGIDGDDSSGCCQRAAAATNEINETGEFA